MKIAKAPCTQVYRLINDPPGSHLLPANKLYSSSSLFILSLVYCCSCNLNGFTFSFSCEVAGFCSSTWDLKILHKCCVSIPQVHSKDKKYVCKVCSRVFMSAASVGIKHGSRRHGVCADCSGRGMAALLDHNGEVGGDISPEEELYPGDRFHDDQAECDGDGEGEEEMMVEGDGEMLGEGEEDRGKWKDSGMTAETHGTLDNEKEESDSSAQEGEQQNGSEKDFAWIS